MARYKKFKFIMEAGAFHKSIDVISIDSRDYTNYFDWDDIPGDELKDVMEHIEGILSEWVGEKVDYRFEEVE